MMNIESLWKGLDQCCPFCGKMPRVGEDCTVMCQNRLCGMYAIPMDRERWNTRFISMLPVASEADIPDGEGLVLMPPRNDSSILEDRWHSFSVATNAYGTRISIIGHYFASDSNDPIAYCPFPNIGEPFKSQ